MAIEEDGFEFDSVEEEDEEEQEEQYDDTE